MSKTLIKIKGKKYEADLSTDDYVQGCPLDPQRLAEFLKQAKGENETMAQFAMKCKLNEKGLPDENGKPMSPSTFSRIANGKIVRSLPIGLIDAIIAHAVNKESIDRDEIMRANGMISSSELSRQRFEHNAEDRKNKYESIKHIIADELYARGCMIRIYPKLPANELPESRFDLHLPSRMTVTVQGHEPKFWSFVFDTPIASFLRENEDENSRIRSNANELISIWNRIFLRDMWEPETMTEVKHSFVFTDKQLYKAFCDLIMTVKVNGCMSAILIDIKIKKVVEEKQIPRKDKKILPSVFDLVRIF